jgi:hypothetical protein
MNLITNPNPVYSHSYTWQYEVMVEWWVAGGTEEALSTICFSGTTSIMNCWWPWEIEPQDPPWESSAVTFWTMATSTFFIAESKLWWTTHRATHRVLETLKMRKSKEFEFETLGKTKMFYEYTSCNGENSCYLIDYWLVIFHGLQQNVKRSLRCKKCWVWRNHEDSKRHQLLTYRHFLWENLCCRDRTELAQKLVPWRPWCSYNKKNKKKLMG